MHALQWIYTSSRKGQGGFAGLSVWALSPGISDEEEEELLKLASYTCLSSLPKDSAQEKIDTLFPVVFRAGVLVSSGKKYILRSGYVGQDYSNRWGNFLAHVLIFQNGDPQRYSTDFIAWEGWKKRLAETEDNGELQSPLPAIEENEFAVIKEISISDIAAFLKAKSGRIDTFVKALSAVFLSRGEGKRLVIRDTWDNACLWAASLQKVFPLAVAQNLSYCTFLNRPDNAAHINITVPDSKFELDDIAVRRDFYIFDLTSASSVPTIESDAYALTIAEWLISDETKVSKYLDFVTNFDFEMSEQTLPLSQDLFILVSEENDACDSSVADLIDFFVSHARKEAFSTLTKTLSPLLNNLDSAAVPAEAITRLCRFVLENANGEAEDFSAILGQLWTFAFKKALFQNQETSELAALRKEIEDKFPEAELLIKRSLLSQQCLDTFKEQANCLDGKSASILGQYVSEAIAGLNQPQAWRGQAMLDLIEALSEESRKAFVLSIPDFGSMAVFFISSTKCSWGGALAELSLKISHEAMWKVRQDLAAYSMDGALTSEFSALLETSPDVKKTFEDYADEVRHKLPSFWEKSAPSFYDIYLEKLPAEQQLRQCKSWLAEDVFCQKLTERYAPRWLKQIANALPLDASDTAEDFSIPQITALAESMKIEFEPNVIVLRGFNRLINEGLKEQAFNELKNLSGCLKGIGKEQYLSFLNLNLPKIFSLARNKAEIRAIMEFLALPVLEEVFYRKLFAFLPNIFRRFRAVKDSSPLPNRLDLLILDYWFSCPQSLFEAHCQSLAAAMEDCGREQSKFYKNEFSAASPRRWKSLAGYLKKTGLIDVVLGGLLNFKK